MCFDFHRRLLHFGTPIMKNASLHHPIHTAFAFQHEKSLRNWSKLIAEGTGPIIAISRKAPRLIELGVREGIIPESLLSRVTTERGMVVEPNEVSIRSTAKVTDDIVIVGSTFRWVSEVADCIY